MEVSTRVEDREPMKRISPWLQTMLSVGPTSKSMSELAWATEEERISLGRQLDDQRKGRMYMARVSEVGQQRNSRMQPPRTFLFSLFIYSRSHRSAHSDVRQKTPLDSFDETRVSSLHDTILSRYYDGRSLIVSAL